MDKGWQLGGMPLENASSAKEDCAQPSPAQEATVTLAKLCGYAVDLTRGKLVWMNREEQEVFAAIARMGYLEFRPQPHNPNIAACYCLHPTLFEFFFFYRWLPEHGHNFRPKRK